MITKLILPIKNKYTAGTLNKMKTRYNYFTIQLNLNKICCGGVY